MGRRVVDTRTGEVVLQFVTFVLYRGTGDLDEDRES